MVSLTTRGDACHADGLRCLPDVGEDAKISIKSAGLAKLASLADRAMNPGDRGRIAILACARLSANATRLSAYGTTTTPGVSAWRDCQVREPGESGGRLRRGSAAMRCSIGRRIEDGPAPLRHQRPQTDRAGDVAAALARALVPADS